MVKLVKLVGAPLEPTLRPPEELTVKPSLILKVIVAVPRLLLLKLVLPTSSFITSQVEILVVEPLPALLAMVVMAPLAS